MSVTHDPEVSPITPAAGRRLVALLPGTAAAAGVAAVATVLGGFAPMVGAPVFAIVAGIAVARIRTPSERLRPGLAFAGTQVLQGSIVVLGLGLSFRQVIATGRSSLPTLLGTLAVALVAAWLAGRALRIRADLQILVGVGTAICGASAIAATDAVIGADEADVSYAIATIFTFNVVAVLACPTLGHLVGLSPQAFGLWAGTAINDTSSVVAAATVYGHGAVSHAVVVKLTRTLAIVPVCVALAAWHNWRRVEGGSARRRPDLRRIFPAFVLGFVAAVAIGSAGLVPAYWHYGLSEAATGMITVALAAVGLSTRPGHIRRAGARPIAFGAVLWATVGLASLALQAWT